MSGEGQTCAPAQARGILSRRSRQLIGQVLANRYREDLEQAGIGSGRHGFVFKPPAGLVFAPEEIEVRRSLDGAALERTGAARQMLQTEHLRGHASAAA